MNTMSILFVKKKKQSLHSCLTIILVLLFAACSFNPSGQILSAWEETLIVGNNTTKGEKTMSKEKESKYNTSSTGRTYGYDKKGGWDIDTSDKTQKTSDSGHIPGRYQWEETIDVSAEDEEHEEND